MRVFPVAGGARYSDDYSSEATATARKHLGNDLFAPEGTPLLAVDDGTVKFGTDPLGGNVANLRTADGTRYYYAHLSGFAGSSRQVQAGEVIGYVGTTGNAQGKSPHCHFEVHPQGGAAVDPFPYLQQASVGTAAAPSSNRLLVLAALAAAGYYVYRSDSAVRAFVQRLT